MQTCGTAFTHIRLTRASRFARLSQRVPSSRVLLPSPSSLKQPCIRSMSTGHIKDRQFGKFPVDSSQTFAESQLSFAFVNLKPVVPGHVLVSPDRITPHFQDLSSDEVADLWLLVQKVGRVIKPHFQAESLTFAVQDGPAAGQSVPHVHVHVLPRKKGDFANNDEVYDAIDDKANAYNPENTQKLDMEAERRLRTPEEMAAEASELRQAMTETK